MEEVVTLKLSGGSDKLGKFSGGSGRPKENVNGGRTKIMKIFLYANDKFIC